MNITVAGTGYVGLVTGVCLSEVGHTVTCVDIDEKKVQLMQQGISPIYEPGLDELMKKNISESRLFFTTEASSAYKQADVIYIAVGTPEKEDGSADLSFVHQVAQTIATSVEKDTIVVTKSTVPVGTNDYIQQLMDEYKKDGITISVVSNPEFLREGSAIHDTFHGDRIVIGAREEKTAETVASIYNSFHIPIMKTDVRSAEMIKYAANAFLATKISFINEIANICEKLGADIEDVATGIGQDKRIGAQFLNAGIGYGGSCFPKDTKALVQIAGNVEHHFELLESVIKVNNQQQLSLFQKAKNYCESFTGKKVAILGLAFKPNTDDTRESAAFVLAKELLNEGAEIIAYDPLAIENAKKELGANIQYTEHIEEALSRADIAFIVTEWEAVKNFPLTKYEQLMKSPVIFDGRNCYKLEDVQKTSIHYVSVGRKVISNAPTKG